MTASIRRLAEAGELAMKYRFRRADGEYRWIADRIKFVREGDNTQDEVVGCLLDVSERRQADERIRYLAYFDALTGLPNRSFMRELLDHAVERAVRYQRCVAVLFLDIDHFKRFNDTLGHDAGDHLLREVANRLQACVRAADQVSRQSNTLLLRSSDAQEVSRLGGDEFVIILTEIPDAEAAASAARRIAEALLTPFRLAHDDVTVSVSIGISVFPGDGTDAETMLKHADAAMY